MVIASKEIEVGYALPVFTKKAKLHQPPGGYRWGFVHNEAYAKSIGLRGAILPGVITGGYISEMLTRFFGENWFKYGKLEMKFIGSGAVDKEMLKIQGVVKEKAVEGNGVRLILDVWVENELDTKITVGTASCLVN